MMNGFKIINEKINFFYKGINKFPGKLNQVKNVKNMKESLLKIISWSPKDCPDI